MLSPVLSLRTLRGSCLEVGTPKLGAHAQSEMSAARNAVQIVAELEAMAVNTGSAVQRKP